MQSYSHDDYFERSDGLKRAWLAPGELNARAHPATMNRSIACRMEQGLLVIVHRAEIAHVRACCDKR
jgi:hypothetical protein